MKGDRLSLAPFQTSHKAHVQHATGTRFILTMVQGKKSLVEKLKRGLSLDWTEIPPAVVLPGDRECTRWQTTILTQCYVSMSTNVTVAETLS